MRPVLTPTSLGWTGRAQAELDGVDSTAPLRGRGKKQKLELQGAAPVDGARLSQRPASPLALLSASTAVLPATSLAGRVARRLGLKKIHAELLREGAQRLGLELRELQQLTGHSFQVTRDTPTGFAAAGEVRWPPNQSRGRYLGLEMARTVIVRPGARPAILKIKGSGQAHDHPQVRQRINDRPRPPLPYPLLWNREFGRTGTPQFGLQRSLAEQELSTLLKLHAVSRVVHGRWASAPIPVDVSVVEQVQMDGKAVSLARARSDADLWGGAKDYYQRDQEDMFRRLRTIDPQLVLGARDLRDFREQAAKAKLEEKRRLLANHGIEHSGLSAEARDEKYAALLLAIRFGEHHPLAQLTLLEAGQYRNNVVDIWNDSQVVADRRALLDELLSQHLATIGVAYRPPPAAPSASFEDYHAAALAPYRAVAEKAVESCLSELGRTYGIARALGGDTTDGFHAKDAMGGEITDWLDIDLLPSGRDRFHSLQSWDSYQDGIAVSVTCLSQLFGLSWERREHLDQVWRDAARDALVRTVKAGLSGELDEIFGRSAKGWRDWVEGERSMARKGGGALRDALAR